MVFPFGVSISDFIEDVRLLKDAVEAFSDARGARADYQELSRSLGSLDKALKTASAVKLDTDMRREAMASTIKNCQNCVTNFLVNIAKFKVLGGPKASTAVIVAGFRKIQWATCKKEDVFKFRSEVKMHIGAVEMLLLSFQVESLLHLKEDVKKTHTVLVSMKDCMTSQTETSMKLIDAIDAQGANIRSVEESSVCQTTALKEHGNFLFDMQHKLRSALSPDDQQTLFRIVQDMLKKNERLENQVQALDHENQGLKRQILDMKTSVQVQRNVPPQVLLQQPVILHDALGRIAPFHLEFINSASALVAVLQVRFENRGLRKIMLQQYGLRDANKQKEIDIYKPWETVFLPGQHVDMSMHFLNGGLARNQCHGCSFHDPRVFKEEEQVKCPLCPMIYRRTKHQRGFVEENGSYLSAVEFSQDTSDCASDFCRVDLIESNAVQRIGVGGGPGWCNWYCCECRDGPIGAWQSYCPLCGHSVCESCSSAD